MKLAGDFSKETLHKLVIFCTRDSICPEMQYEVLKIAARGIAFGQDRKELKFTLSIQGWGDPELFDIDGDHFAELSQIEKKIGVQVAIVSVQQFEFFTISHDPVAGVVLTESLVLDERIVKQLLLREVDKLGLRLPKVMMFESGFNPEKPLLSLMKASKKWRVEFLYIEDNKDIWATLASIANNGSIKHLRCKIGSRWLNDVNLADVRKVWEISTKAVFQVPLDFGSRQVLVSNRGGRSGRGSLEENWQNMVDLAQTVDEEPEDEETLWGTFFASI